MAHPIKEGVRAFMAYDDARDSAPGEHWIVLFGALALGACALRATSRPRAVLAGAAAGVLLFRAAEGRDGVRRWVDLPPAG